MQLHSHLEVGPRLDEAHRRDELEVAVQLGRDLELHLQGDMGRYGEIWGDVGVDLQRHLQRLVASVDQGDMGEIWGDIGGHLQRGLAPVDEHEVVAKEVAEDAPGQG